MEEYLFKKTAQEIAGKLNMISKKWDGKEAILEMKKAQYSQWRQMEWIGFYFQFLCEKSLRKIMQIPGTKYGNVRFDGFKNFPWDFKAHIENDVYGNRKTIVIINDKEAIDNCIRDFTFVGIVIAVGTAEYNDRDRSFQNWVEELKGGKSKYEIERIERGANSRLRKTSFYLRDVVFIRITESDLSFLGTYNQGRNSNGDKRRPKYMMDLSDLKNMKHYSLLELS